MTSRYSCDVPIAPLVQLHRAQGSRRCPRAKELVGQKADGEVFHWSAGCKVRTCLVCGKRWKRAWLQDLQAMVGNDTGRIWLLQCTSTEWETVRRRLNRRRKLVDEDSSGFIRFDDPCGAGGLIVNDLGFGELMDFAEVIRLVSEVLERIAEYPNTTRVRPSNGWKRKLSAHRRNNPRGTIEMIGVLVLINTAKRTSRGRALFRVFSLSEQYDDEQLAHGIAHSLVVGRSRTRRPSPTSHQLRWPPTSRRLP